MKSNLEVYEKEEEEKRIRKTQNYWNERKKNTVNENKAISFIVALKELQVQHLKTPATVQW